MDQEFFRYVLGALFAAIVHLHFAVNRCTSSHAKCEQQLSGLRADMAGMKSQLDALD